MKHPESGIEMSWKPGYWDGFILRLIVLLGLLAWATVIGLVFFGPHGRTQ